MVHFLKGSPRFPGRVTAVTCPGSGRLLDSALANKMLSTAITTLTECTDVVEAWRLFFEPGDVVGIKLNAVARPYQISSPWLLRSIVDALGRAGIRSKDIIVYDRWTQSFLQAGFDRWLPDGVRWMSASEQRGDYQMDMKGYDESQYVELPLIHPIHLRDYTVDDVHIRRSYFCRFLTQHISKLVNVCVLKHHQAAGVTLALKNLSHGLANNVSRSHPATHVNACATFIPALAAHAAVTSKVAINILDGTRASYHGGPGPTVRPYLWNHDTLYMSTDPVALDYVGLAKIEAERSRRGLQPLARATPDEVSQWEQQQPCHVAVAGMLGLGVSDPTLVDLRTETLVA